MTLNSISHRQESFQPLASKELALGQGRREAPSWKYSPKDFSPPPHLAQPGLKLDPNRRLAPILTSGGAPHSPTSVVCIWPPPQGLYLSVFPP